MAETTDPDEVAAAIDSLLATENLDRLVHLYFARPHFAGVDFDLLWPSDPNRFEPSDLVAVNLLDIRMRPEAIRALLSGTFEPLLRDLPVDLRMWDDDFSEGSEAWMTASDLYTEVRKLPEVGPTTASKLLARKRPWLVPIRDSVIEQVLCVEGVSFWAPLREALLDESRRARIDGLVRSVHVSTLRRLDVAAWMAGSNSTNAKEAREAAGVVLQAPPWIEESS